MGMERKGVGMRDQSPLKRSFERFFEKGQVSNLDFPWIKI